MHKNGGKNKMDRQDVLRIVYEEYGTKPEYPNDEWNAVLRRKDNGKCYGIIREMECRKLGIQADGIIDILEVRVNEANSRLMLQNYGYYKTRFENDKKWIGIMLGIPETDGSIKKLLKKSYNLTKYNE